MLATRQIWCPTSTFQAHLKQKAIWEIGWRLFSSTRSWIPTALLKCWMLCAKCWTPSFTLLTHRLTSSMKVYSRVKPLGWRNGRSDSLWIEARNMKLASPFAWYNFPSFFIHIRPATTCWEFTLFNFTSNELSQFHISLYECFKMMSFKVSRMEALNEPKGVFHFGITHVTWR